VRGSRTEEHYFSAEWQFPFFGRYGYLFTALRRQMTRNFESKTVSALWSACMLFVFRRVFSILPYDIQGSLGRRGLNPVVVLLAQFERSRE